MCACVFKRPLTWTFGLLVLFKPGSKAMVTSQSSLSWGRKKENVVNVVGVTLSEAFYS